MPQERFANIDGLRAVAALCVMVEHLGDLLRQTAPGAGPMRAVGTALSQSVSLGRYGVAIFFLISGFVVPFSIRGERPLAHFAISRLFRLYPALWFALAVLTATAWVSGEPPATATVLANMTMAPTILGQPWLSPIYWTLFVELVFYLLVALLFSAGALRRVGVLLAVALGLIAATVLPVTLRIHGLANLPVQYLGLHLAWLFVGLLLRLGMVERRRGGDGGRTPPRPRAGGRRPAGGRLLPRARRPVRHRRTHPRHERLRARGGHVLDRRSGASPAFDAARPDRADQLRDVSPSRERERRHLSLDAIDGIDAGRADDGDLHAVDAGRLLGGLHAHRASDDPVGPAPVARIGRPHPAGGCRRNGRFQHLAGCRRRLGHGSPSSIVACWIRDFDGVILTSAWMGTPWARFSTAALRDRPTAGGRRRSARAVALP
ncbi:acyltransferase [Methylobacterium sp. J-059]|uniref:acyltransferase family protein n=1 Tax=Methylobacterium sp. J-059 TaxID=2836643 RepID=UPI001FB9A2BE|nr:acyltransferase [Methylobacterium sp. J-059]MCJ2041941.1 acyltransferase [Methylobacterium sp. J-059]